MTNFLDLLQEAKKRSRFFWYLFIKLKIKTTTYFENEQISAQDKLNLYTLAATIIIISILSFIKKKKIIGTYKKQ